MTRHFDELISVVERTPSVSNPDAAIKIGKILSRKDIQQILGVSKATSVRKIEEWLKSGAVKSMGKGPTTKYEVMSAKIFED